MVKRPVEGSVQTHPQQICWYIQRYSAVSSYPNLQEQGSGFFRQVRKIMVPVTPQQGFPALEDHKTAAEPLQLIQRFHGPLPPDVSARPAGTLVIRAAVTTEVAANGPFDGW